MRNLPKRLISPEEAIPIDLAFQDIKDNVPADTQFKIDNQISNLNCSSSVLRFRVSGHPGQVLRHRLTNSRLQ